MEGSGGYDAVSEMANEGKTVWGPEMANEGKAVWGRTRASLSS